MNETKDQSKVILKNIIDTNSAQHRQEIIRKIQKILKAKLITYVANPNHPVSIIMREDAVLFEDLLRSVSDSKKAYLMLNSPGGDPNAAEKLLLMCRERFTEGFYVIVPNYAKSAATLICLGSDKILMGYLAELGPIDPQIQIGPFPQSTLPARSFIDGLETIRKRIKEEGDPPTIYLPLLSQIKPELIAICESAIEHSRMIAAKWLKKYMMKNNERQAELVAEWLSNGINYKSHGKMIDFTEARDVLKLNVERIEPNSELWDYIWELYVRSVEFMRRIPNCAKLFESESVSLNMVVELRPLSLQSSQPTTPPRQSQGQPPPK